MRPAADIDLLSQGSGRDRRPSLRRNFAWTLLGNFVYGGCQWGMVVVIAKLGTPEMVGRFALAFAVTAPIFSLTAMNMRAVLATDQRNEYRFGDYFSLQVILLSVGVLISICVALVFFERSDWTVLGLVAVAKLVEGLSDVYLGYLQHGEQMQFVSRSLSLKGLLSVVALTLGLWAGGTIEWGAFGLLAAWAGVLLFYDTRKAAEVARATTTPALRPRWNSRSHLRIAALAAPLGVTVCLASLLINVPRYFIEHTFGPRELGLFAALAYFMIVGARVVTALGESAAPRLALHYAMGEYDAFRHVLGRMLVVGVTVGFVGIVCALAFGEPLLALVYRPEYATRSSALVVIMIASAFSYVAAFLQYAVTASRHFRSQPGVVMVSLAALAVACSRLVPEYGSTGAGIAMGIGFAVQVVGFAVITYGALRTVPRGST